MQRSLLFGYWSRRGLRAAAVAGLLLLAGVSAARAQGTAAGTTIPNAATVSYRAANNASFAALSDTVQVTVAAARRVVLTQSHAVTNNPGDSTVLPHTVVNAGNIPDAFTLDASGQLGWWWRWFLDVNHNGLLDAGDTAITAPVALAPGDSASVLLLTKIPMGAARGTAETMTARATSAHDATVVAQQADVVTVRSPNVTLTLAKAVTTATATAGDALTYTLTYHLVGSGTASNIVVVDTLPAGTAYIAGSMLAGSAVSDAVDGDAGSYDAAARVVSFRLASLAAGASGSLAFQVRVNAGMTGSVRNVAAANWDADVGTMVVASNAVQTSLLSPVVTLEKHLETAGTVQVGQDVAYTIRYANASTTLAARSVVLTDTLPVGLAYVSSQPAAQVEGRVLSWTLGDLAPESAGEIRLATRVTWSQLSPTELVNIAALQGFNVAAQSSVATAVQVSNAAAAALDLEKTSAVLAVALGETAPFRLTLRNSGLVSLPDLRVQDVLPQGTRLIAGSVRGADSVTSAGNIVTFFVPGVLAAGDSLLVRYEIAVVAPRGELLQNTAIASAAGETVQSASRTALLRVLRGQPMATRAAIGKVWVDANLNGIQDADEPGLAGVDVWSEDGDIATSDNDGRFSFRNVRTGRHAWRLDVSTLPADYQLLDADQNADLDVRDADGWSTPRITFRVIPRAAALSAIRVPLSWQFLARPVLRAQPPVAATPAPVVVAPVVNGPSAGETPAAPAVDTARPVAVPLILRGINFETGKATFTPATHRMIMAIADSLVAHPDLRIEISGHTDARGGETFNDDLSERRANAVRFDLEYHGVDLSRTRAVGFGPRRPVATNATVDGRALNRRVEMAVLDDTTGQGTRDLARLLARVGALRGTIPLVATAPVPVVAAVAVAPVPAGRQVEYAVDVPRSANELPGARIRFSPAADSAQLIVNDSARTIIAGDLAVLDGLRRGDRVQVLAWARTTADSAAATLETSGAQYRLDAMIHNPLMPVSGEGALVAVDALPAPTDVPFAVLSLAPVTASWPRAVYALPAGWTAEPGSTRLGGEAAADPMIVRDRAGNPLLSWDFAGRAPAPLTVRLRRADSTVVAVASPARVAALRTEGERLADEQNAFLSGPAVRFFAPRDGMVSAADRLFIGVRGEPGANVSLFDGDSLIGGAKLRGDGVADFVAIPLSAGTHTLRVRMINSWSQPRWDSATVHVTGRPASFATAATLRLEAGGQATADVSALVRDRWNVAVADRPLVTVSVEGAEVLNADEDASSTGRQVRPDSAGVLALRLRGGRDAGEGRLILRAGAIADTVSLEILPPVRPLMFIGVGRVGIGAAPEAFGSLTARGRLNGRTSLVLHFDSRRLDAGSDAFGRSNDPQDPSQYPILGDAGAFRSAGASQTRFSARLERGFDWLGFGDVHAAVGRDLRLARYERSLGGAAGHVTTGAVSWEGFASSTRQSLQQRQIRGEGISGPYTLDRAMRAGTEQVAIEVRAFDNAQRTVARQVLTRFADYQIDYLSGTLLLKQPVPAADAYGNPMFIVVSYEAEGAGSAHAVWGIRSSVNAGRVLGLHGLDSARIGATWVRDQRADGAFDLIGTDVRFSPLRGVRVIAELAHASSRDSSGLASSIEAGWRLGTQLELSARWTKVGGEFRNPSNIAAQGGTDEIAFSGRWSLNSGTIHFDHTQQHFGLQGVDRQRSALGLVQPFLKNFAFEAGVAADATTDPTSTTSQSGAEARLRWRPRQNLSLFTEAYRSMSSAAASTANPDYIGIGAALRLSENVSLEGRHRQVLTKNGYGVTDFTTRTRVGAGTEAWGSYQLANVDGGRTAALVGLSNRARFGAWAFNTMFEKRSGLDRALPADPMRALPFLQNEENYWSAGLGLELVPEQKPYRASFRSEIRNGDQRSTRLLGLSGDLSLNRSLALLSRQEFVQADQLFNATRQMSRRWSSLMGVAFRPVNSDKLNALAKAELVDATNPAGGGVLTSQGQERRLILATEAIWAPRRSQEFALRLATRRTTASQLDADGSEQLLQNAADFIGWRAWVGADRRLSFRTEGRVLVEHRSGTTRWDVAPQAVFRPVTGIEIAGGVRFGDLHDPDFAVSGGHGAFITVGAQITERSLRSVADFWRARGF